MLGRIARRIGGHHGERVAVFSFEVRRVGQRHFTCAFVDAEQSRIVARFQAERHATGDVASIRGRRGVNHTACHVFIHAGVVARGNAWRHGVNRHRTQLHRRAQVSGHVGLTHLHGIRRVHAFYQSEHRARACRPAVTVIGAVFPCRTSFQSCNCDHAIVGDAIVVCRTRVNKGQGLCRRSCIVNCHWAQFNDYALIVVRISLTYLYIICAVHTFNQNEAGVFANCPTATAINAIFPGCSLL